MDGLRTQSVTDIAENDGQLLETYKNEVHVEVTGKVMKTNLCQTKYNDAEIEGAVPENRDWITPNPFRVWGPHDHITAVIINGSDKRDATVSILKGNVCIKTYDLKSMEDVIMVFLDPGFYCWCMEGSQVKFIKPK
jgi:hypothetical protein